MRSSDPLTVLLAANTRFLVQLGVCVRSLAEQHPAGGLRLVVLTDDISPADRALVELVAEPLAVEWHEVGAAALGGVSLPSRLTLASAFRLLGPSRVATSTGRLVYLDADTVVLEPLTALATVALYGHPVGAVSDSYFAWFSLLDQFDDGLPWRQLGLDGDSPYFNSGVLVIDQAAWAAADVERRSLELLRHYRLPLGDQCALNLVLAGAWAELPPRWNAQSNLGCPHPGSRIPLIWDVAELREARDHPAVLHFCVGFCGRPWEPGCRHPRADVWHDVRARTPWAGGKLTG